MGLLELEFVAPLLICPRCGRDLHEREGGFECSSTNCVFHRPAAFASVESWPVLIDYERSILAPYDLSKAENGTTVPAAARRWAIDRLPRHLRGIWKPLNKVAVRNIDLLLQLAGPSPLVLVVGGATVGNGTEAIYADARARIIAFDIYGSAFTQFIADAHQIPIASGRIDAVLIQAVLEHVVDPPRVVEEIHRVLRPGGLVYAETPFLQQVHAGPHDFIRYTSSGHRYLFRSFDEIVAGPVAGPATQLLWSIDHLVRGLLRSELAGKMARAVFSPLRYLDRFIPASFAMDSASAYYFLGRRSERELSVHEVIEYYRGAQRSRQPR